MPTNKTTVPTELALAEARASAAAILKRFGSSEHLVVFRHFDADGLAAGAIFGRGLKRGRIRGG